MRTYKNRYGKKHNKKISVLPYAVGTMAVILTIVLMVSISEYQMDIKKALADTEGGYLANEYYCQLVIPNSDIIFPVMKTTDNEKYLHTSATGEESQLGAIFMDYRCNFNNPCHIIIYGHDAGDLDGNLLMFGKLRQYLNQDFIDTHMRIQLSDNQTVKNYEVFAIKVTDVFDDAYQLDFDTDEDFKQFLHNIEAPYGTEGVLTLSTCLGQDKDTRLIIQASQVKMKWDMYNKKDIRRNK